MSEQPTAQVPGQVVPGSKPWYQSRQLLINMVLIGLAAAESQLNILQPLLPVNIYTVLTFALPVVNMMLRVTRGRTAITLGPEQALPLDQEQRS